MSRTPAAVVTGSSRGIGRAVAEQLAANGYAVAVNYVRQRETADEVVAGIKSNGGQAIAIGGNVAVPADRQRLIETAMHEFGRCDVLVNNAGITSPGRKDLLEATTDAWDLVMETNLNGPFFLAQIAARRMIELIAADTIPHGAIINVSSISAYAVSTNRADYCIAKAAMQMMTWLLASRLADERIRVYEVCPGVIASDMTAPVREKYDRQIAEGLTPIRRWGTPQDVARTVAALLTDAFAFSTGDRVNVDGGFHIRRL